MTPVDLTPIINDNSIIERLSDIQYLGIGRTYNFIDNERYEIITDITLYNKGNDTCFYVPGDIYRKEILMDFNFLSFLFPIQNGDIP